MQPTSTERDDNMKTLQRIKNFFNPKSLNEKLVAIVAEMPRLTKNGHRADFDYLQITDLANAFYGIAKKEGVILIPNDLRTEIGEDTAWVETEFKVTDGKEWEHFTSYGFARGAGPWGALPIAQTMALKSFLKRLGMVFGEEDNAEFESRELVRELYAPPAIVCAENFTETLSPILSKAEVEQKIADATAQNAADLEARVEKANRQWNAICKAHGKTLKQRREYLWAAWGAKSFASLVDHPEKAKKAIAWADGTESPLETMETSLKAEAQPVATILDAEPEPLEPF